MLGGVIRLGPLPFIWYRNLWKFLLAQQCDGAKYVPRSQHSHVFSTLNLIKGYYQVKMCLEDIPKTIIIMPFGLFEFVPIPFCLRNAGSKFQCMMDHVLAGLLLSQTSSL